MRLAEGLHRIGTGMINAYLVAEGREVTIIDAGLPGFWDLLPGELLQMGREPKDIRAVVLTHGHSDHIGFAERGRRLHGWPVMVHEIDAPLARGEVPNPAKGLGPVRLGALVSFFVYSARRGGLRSHRLGAVTTFGDGATLEVPGAPRVILVPGHTPGSAALHVPSRNALFVGDAIATLAVTTGAVGPMIAPFSADPEEARRSLSRIRDIEADWLLPGHGHPWTDGVEAAVATILA